MRSLSFKRIAVISLMPAALAFALAAQTTDNSPQEGSSGFKRAEEPAPTHNLGSYVVPEGTHILLSMINSVSTKQAAVGDRIYLETAFPILANGQIVIPQGSWVQGTVTQVKRPGRVKGRGQLYVRFDSLTLPNGVNRDFRARIGAMDGRSTEQVNKEEGKITSAGNKGGDAATVAQSAGAGAGVGTLIGAAAGHYGMGAGIGGAAGAAAGLAGVLLSRGPDATLTKGTTMEMVLDRPLAFTKSEIDFRNAAPRPPMADSGSGPEQPQQNQRRWTPWPF
jgi:type IV secretion system protein VirB10